KALKFRLSPLRIKRFIMSLSNEQKKRYRSIGHGLNPVVTIAANGISANVLAEIDRALNDHELIKIKLVIEDKDSRKKVISSIIEAMNASVVQEIGKVVVLLRPAKQPNKKLSNLLR
ncbi:MAG: RNA-binding protein, partial [Cellvibrionaceae bacterium]